MGTKPAGVGEIVLKGPVPGRAMSRFVNEAHGQPRSLIVGHGKSNGIGRSLLGQPWTARGIPEVAKLSQLIGGGFGTFMTRGGALPMPSVSQREPRRVDPATVVALRRRHEERARHALDLLPLR